MFIIWPNKKVALKTSLEATQSTWLVLIAILFTNRDEKFRRKKVEQVCSIALDSFSDSRVQITLSLVLSVFLFLLLPKFLNFDF